jgi:hypothetical protein
MPRAKRWQCSKLLLPGLPHLSCKAWQHLPCSCTFHSHKMLAMRDADSFVLRQDTRCRGCARLFTCSSSTKGCVACICRALGRPHVAAAWSCQWHCLLLLTCTNEAGHPRRACLGWKAWTSQVGGLTNEHYTSAFSQTAMPDTAALHTLLCDNALLAEQHTLNSAEYHHTLVTLRLCHPPATSRRYS